MRQTASPDTNQVPPQPEVNTIVVQDDSGNITLSTHESFSNDKDMQQSGGNEGHQNDSPPLSLESGDTQTNCSQDNLPQPESKFDDKITIKSDTRKRNTDVIHGASASSENDKDSLQNWPKAKLGQRGTKRKCAQPVEGSPVKRRKSGRLSKKR